MKTVKNWEELLSYVNRLGLVNRTMPIGWKQQVLMTNVKNIEAKASGYPLKIRFWKKENEFLIANALPVKVVHS